MASITRSDGGSTIDIERCLVRPGSRGSRRDQVTFWVPSQLAPNVVPGQEYELKLDDGRALRMLLEKAVTSSAIPGMAMYRGEIDSR